MGEEEVFILKKNRLIAAVSSAAIFAGMLSSFTVSFAAGPTTLTVGAGGQYASISDAVAQAKTINPQSESERVTINVAPGNYEEQVRFDNVKFITLQQTPGTEGKVNLNWYYCTGYCTSNTDLNGLYNPKIDWSKDETWNGYHAGDEKFTKYEIGQRINGKGTGTATISYYDLDGVKHKDAPVNSQLTHLGALGWSYDKMAPLIVTRSSSDITVKDLNIVNSVPVMVTQGQIDGHLTPERDRAWGVATSNELPTRDGLTICSEDTVPVKPTADIFSGNGSVDKTKLKKYIDNGGTFNAGESIWLAQSSAYNERGHAIATLGDRVIFENVRARGNQDSVWASDGRAYFKNCTLIGGTDYIYGSASAVFDNCKLGFAGFTDTAYGNPLTTPNTDKSRKYGYLFWNCTVYNECSTGGESNLGGPWGADAQATFYNTKIDIDGEIGNSKTKITPKGWGRFGAENGLARLYEYGTKTTKGNDVDLSQRIVNKPIAEGGTGMGTVLDRWQILEFNPRNYFAADCDTTGNWKDNWDPMNFSAELAKVDAAIAGADVSVPAGEATSVELPQAPAGITYKWVSASSNAVVSSDGKKLNVTRPAAGEEAINTTVTLYAMDNEKKIGDKKDVAVTINPTTDTANVFNIPVSITQSTNTTNKYTVTISKNGALIKSQIIEVSGGAADVVISNIPASTDGIEYDVAVVSESNDFTIIAPEDGKTVITGITGKDVELNLTATKLIDQTVDVKINTTAANGNKTYDLIALAKAQGADNGISSSDVISVEMDVLVGAALNKTSYIDISSGTPSGDNKAVAQRFTCFKLNNSWTQIDTVDNTQSFSGSSNHEHQCLNVTGKFDYSTTHHIKATIDYKAQTVTVDGSNSGKGKTKTPWTFGSFPEAEKGKLNMGVFIGNTGDSIAVSNVVVTYKKVVTGDEPEPTATPKPADVVYNFRDGNNPYINTTNSSSTDPRGSVDGNDYDIEGDGSVIVSKDAYYNNDHGLVVWGGDNKIKIKVDGPTEIKLGGCAYSSASTVTLKANGSAVETQAYAKNCWQGTTNADNVNTFTYEGDAAELTVAFDNYVYLPMLEVKKLDAEVVTPEPKPLDVVYDLRANDNPYINAANSNKDDPRGSVDGSDYDFEKDGRVVFSNDCYQSQTSHGVVVWGGDNKIKIKVDGPTEITVGGCAFSAANNVTLKANGSEVETQAYAKNCWQGTATADNVNKFIYTGDAAELTVVFDSYVYLSMLGIKAIESVPAPEVTIEKIAESANEGSAPAAAYTGTFNNNGYKSSVIKWTVNGDKESKMDISITGESTVVFGLVVTAEKLEDIKTVTAVVE